MDDVIIDKPFLLDIDPPPLHSIIIKPEGYLVWGKKLTQLKVHWIKVEGEMHIGGKDCLYQGNTRVTFLGELQSFWPKLTIQKCISIHLDQK